MSQGDVDVTAVVCHPIPYSAEHVGKFHRETDRDVVNGYTSKKENKKWEKGSCSLWQQTEASKS